MKFKTKIYLFIVKSVGTIKSFCFFSSYSLLLHANAKSFWVNNLKRPHIKHRHLIFQQHFHIVCSRKQEPEVRKAWKSTVSKQQMITARPCINSPHTSSEEVTSNYAFSNNAGSSHQHKNNANCCQGFSCSLVQRSLMAHA